MIPATMQISIDKASKDGDKTVVALVRGTKAERMQLIYLHEASKPQDITDGELIAEALQEFGKGLATGRYSWNSAMADHGLPEHMLRVVIELDNLGVQLEALNAFIGEWPKNPGALFASLPNDDQIDLIKQAAAMTSYAKILHRRLERARSAVE